MYRYEYSNDVGPNDDYFHEFYEIFNPSERIICQVDDEEDAKMICFAMNKVFTKG